MILRLLNKIFYSSTQSDDILVDETFINKLNSRYNIYNLPFHTYINFTKHKFGVKLTIGVASFDREHPSRSIEVKTTSTAEPSFLSDQNRVDEWVLKTIITAMEHEVREFLLVDGVRKFDPHSKSDLSPGTPVLR